VYLGIASSTNLFGDATTTTPFLTSLSKRTTGYELNEEYIFIESLFSTISTEVSKSVFERILNGVDQFGFSTTSADGTFASSSELVIESNDIILNPRSGQIYATWVGKDTDIPYYFCVKDAFASSTALRYGQHIADQITKLANSTSTPLIVDSDRSCRPEIKLDRHQQDVYFYDFLPNSSDLVLLQLEDGLYVTEIDDRAWQNTQLLYPGKDFTVVVENDAIFIQTADYYFEIITEIEPS
jgi:hypothetical protein